jgi:hypothetical protein
MIKDIGFNIEYNRTDNFYKHLNLNMLNSYKWLNNIFYKNYPADSNHQNNYLHIYLIAVSMVVNIASINFVNCYISINFKYIYSY